MKIAVVAIAYNRPDSLARLLNSVSKADFGGDNVDLVISIDKSKTDVVEVYADNYHWSYGNKIVKKHSKNLGLREHILSQGKLFDIYDALIILEDDIIVSPAFYIYARQAVNLYNSNDQIAGISLYSFPLVPYIYEKFDARKNEYDAFFMQTAQSWGEVWMKRQWNDFYAWYLKNTEFAYSDDIPSVMFQWDRSWLKYHTRYCIENDKYFVYPYFAFSSNCGTAGTHAQKDYNNFQTVLQEKITQDLRLPQSIDGAVRYDAFFENEECYSALGLDKNQLCLDLYAQHKTTKKRYLLSPLRLNYKIVKSFGLSLRPIEMNIIKSVEGDVFFLYDTSVSAQNDNECKSSEIILYSLRVTNLWSVIQKYGISRLLKEHSKAILRRLKRIVKR